MRGVLFVLAFAISGCAGVGNSDHMDRGSGLSAADPREPTSYCEAISLVAEGAMEARQKGYPLSEIMRAADVADIDAESLQLLEDVLISAYEQPRQFGDELQKRIVEIFPTVVA